MRRKHVSIDDDLASLSSGSPPPPESPRPLTSGPLSSRTWRPTPPLPRPPIASRSSWASSTTPTIGEQLGINPETLRGWVQQAEIDAGDPAEDYEQRRAAPGRDRAQGPGVAPLERDLEVGVGLLRGGARPPTAVIVEFIDEDRSEFGVEPICRVLQVAPSTYYAAKARPPSPRAVGDGELGEVIAAEHAANYGVYGARKMCKHLHRLGRPVGRCRVERLMRAAGLHGAVRGRVKRTTVPGKDGNRPGDLVNRQFTATAPNQLWVAEPVAAQHRLP